MSAVLVLSGLSSNATSSAYSNANMGNQQHTEYVEGYAWVLYGDGCFRLNYVIYADNVLVYNEPVNPVIWAGTTTICSFSSVIYEMC